MFTISSTEGECGHSSKSTQRSYSKYKGLVELLNECNIIKYAAYRTASKLRGLQKTFYMDHVRLGLIACVFHKHQLQASENEVLLERGELEAVLSDIFFAAHKETTKKYNTEEATDQMMNLLLSIYDSQETGSVQAISAKVALTVLSCAPLEDKYQYFFHQLVDHNNCISKKKMELLLNKLTQITKYLSESFSFGSELISATVDSCFQQAECALGVSEDAFLGWLLKGPQLLVWLSTLYRIQAAENVCHSVKCAVCKTFPIFGLRYQCLVCIRYNQCQTCFLTGRLSRRHKLMHPVQEYCCLTTSKETTLAFLKLLKHKLCRNSAKPLHYLPAEPNIAEHSYGDENLSTRTMHPEQELQSVICHLEQENRLLESWSKGRSRQQVEACLQDHRTRIEAQLHRLRQLKCYLEHMQATNPSVPVNSSSKQDQLNYPTVSRQEEHQARPVPPPHLRYLESTPLVPLAQRVQLSLVEGISPIGHDQHTLSCRSAITPSDRTMGDLSTWLGKGGESLANSTELESWLHTSPDSRPTVLELHGDLDAILERLQNALASNFTLDESFSGKDNCELQKAATEVEDLVMGIIESIQQQKTSS